MCDAIRADHANEKSPAVRQEFWIAVRFTSARLHHRGGWTSLGWNAHQLGTAEEQDVAELIPRSMPHASDAGEQRSGGRPPSNQHVSGLVLIQRPETGHRVPGTRCAAPSVPDKGRDCVESNGRR